MQVRASLAQECLPFSAMPWLTGQVELSGQSVPCVDSSAIPFLVNGMLSNCRSTQVMQNREDRSEKEKVHFDAQIALNALYYNRIPARKRF